MSATARLSCAAAFLALFASLPTASEPPQGAAQPPTFKSGVEYVEVDAIVTTSQGQIVRDLAQKDFEILEDGRRQELTTFALVDIPIERYDGAAGVAQPIEADVTTNEHPEGRVYVLVLDELHTAPGEAARAKAAAKQFIARLGANDLMAVVHTAGGDAGSQEFTNSQSRLLAAVDKSVARGLASATASRNESAFMTDGRDTSDHDDLERAADAQTTLRVVRDVANWFATVHGRRKAILLMSGGIDYPMTLVGDAGAPNRPTDMVRSAAQEAVDAAMRSNVSVYGIDPGGLTGGDDVGTNYFAPGSASLGPRASERELRMNQDSLRELSEQTGGIAVVGRNDLGTAFDRIVADNSAYYVLAYRPPANKRDGRFHKISVRVDRPGLVTRARSGYLSPNGKAPAAPALDPAGPSSEIRDALASPLPVGGLSMRLSFAPFMGAPPNASVLITEDLLGRDLKLGSPGTLELSYAAVDAAGKVRAGSNDRLQLTALKPETKTQITESGLRVFNRMTLAPGRYTVRVAAHDQAGGAVGSDCIRPRRSGFPRLAAEHERADDHVHRHQPYGRREGRRADEGRAAGAADRRARVSAGRSAMVFRRDLRQCRRYAPHRHDRDDGDVRVWCSCLQDGHRALVERVQRAARRIPSPRTCPAERSAARRLRPQGRGAGAPGPR